MSKEKVTKSSETEEANVSPEIQELRYLVVQWFPTTYPDGTKLKVPKSEIKKIRKLAKSLMPELFEDKKP